MQVTTLTPNTIIAPDVLEGFIPTIKKVDFGKNLEEKFKLSLAIGLFVERVVSLERAAQLSGKSMSQFIDILNAKNIPWNEYTEEHLQQDELAIKKYLQEQD